MMNAGAPRWNWLGLFALLLGACGGPPGVLIDIGSWPRGAVSLRVQGTLDGTPAVEPIYYPAETTRFVVYVPRSGQLTLDLVAFDGNDCITAQAQTQQELGGLRALKEADVALAGSNPPLCPAPEILTVTPELAPTDPALPVTLTVRGQNFLPGATVTIDGVPAADVVLASRSEIAATVPKHLGAFGLVPVSVQNFDGRQASRSDLFSYYASRIGFSAMRPYSVGMNAKMPRSVAVADFNRDTYPDLAVANSTGMVSVLLNDKQGGFGAAVEYPCGSLPSSLAVADFNRDGLPDLAAATTGSNSVTILLGDGVGGFAAPRRLANVSSALGVAVGEVNGNSDSPYIDRSTRRCRSGIRRARSRSATRAGPSSGPGAAVSSNAQRQGAWRRRRRPGNSVIHRKNFSVL